MHLHKTAIDQKDIEGYIKSLSDKGIANLIAPTVVAGIFKKMLGGGMFLSVGIDIFLRMIGIDFDGLIKSLCEKIKELISGKSQPTDAEINAAVKQTVDAAFSSAKSTNPIELKTNSSLWEGAPRIKKLGSIHLYHQILKQADVASAKSIASGASATKSFLTTVFSFIFRSIFRIGGAQVAADIAADPLNSLFGVNIFRSTKPTPISKQTKFKKNPSYSDKKEESPWVEFISNDEASIKNMLKSWANQVYLGVDESALNSSSKLDEFVEKIIMNNLHIVGNYIYIPDYKSKKEVVDYFIDDVASISKQ